MLVIIKALNNGIKKRYWTTALKNGIEQGTKNAKIEMAKKLLNQNVDIKIISETTGLSVEDINKLK